MGGKKGNKSKKSKTTTKAQQMAKDRIAAGKTISQVKAANQKSMRDAAAARHANFKAQRSLKAAGGTSAQVAKDNKQYGNTVPAGSFGISEAGKAQAAANIAEKRLSAPGTYGTGMPSNPAYKGVGARETGPVRYKDADYLTATPYVNAFKRTFGPDATLQGNRFNPADRAAALGAGYTDSIIGAVNFGKNNLTLGLGKKLPNIPTLPKFQNANLQALRNFGSVAIPGLQTFGAAQRLSKVGLGQEISQMTTSNAKYTAGIRPQLTKTGITNVNPLTIAKAFTPEMVATGPTAGASAALLGTTTALSAAEQAKAGEQAGGLNIGGSSAEASEGKTTSGDPTGRSIFSMGKGLADFALNDRFDFDNLGRGLFGKGIVTPQDVKSDIKTSIKKIGLPETLATGYETFRDYNRIKDADDKALAFAQNVNADQFEKVLRFADDSKAVQKAGENLETLTGQKNVNLPSDFKAQIRNVIEGAQEVTGGIEQGKENKRGFLSPINPKRVDEINNLLANVNQNPKLSTLSKVAGQFDPATNENAANMTSLQKIAAGFNPSSPNVKALSATDRGIKGSAGNLIIGGKLSDIYRQATGDIEGGVNAGIPTGQVGLSNADMFNVATSAIKNIKTPGTLSEKQADSIQRTIKGGVTAGSLIRGVLPKLGGSGNTTRPNLTIGGSNSVPVEELLINQQVPTVPTTQELQTGVGTEAGNLQSLQQQAYLRALASYGFNPNYFAQVRPRFNTQPKSFSDYFKVRRTT